MLRGPQPITECAISVSASFRGNLKQATRRFKPGNTAKLALNQKSRFRFFVPRSCGSKIGKEQNLGCLFPRGGPDSSEPVIFPWEVLNSPFQFFGLSSHQRKGAKSTSTMNFLQGRTSVFRLSLVLPPWGNHEGQVAMRD